MVVLAATLLIRGLAGETIEGTGGSKVEPLGTVAARLGAAAGQSVEVARDLAPIPVLVDPEGASPQRILSTLGFALHASFVNEGKTLRLERTAADRKSLRTTRLALRRAYVATALTRWDRILKRADGYGDPAAQIKQARADVEQALINARDARAAHRSYIPPPNLMFTSFVSPAGRLLRGIMGRLGPDRLANLDPGEDRYLSDHPNGFEPSLPDCEDLISEYKKAQASYMASTGLPDTSGQVSKLVVHISEAGGQLDLYSTAGKRLDRVGINYQLRAVMVNGNLPYFQSSPSSEWVDLDESTRRVRSFLHPSPQEVRRVPGNALPEEILYPERVDPLNFGVRAGLLALPQAAGGKGRVMVLSDDMDSWTGRCVQDGRLDAPVFAQMLLGEVGNFERVVRNGQTVVRPKDEMSAEAGLCDRKTLGTAVRRYVSQGGMGLQNWSELHLALYSGVYQPLAQIDFGLLARVGPHPIIMYNSHNDGEYALLAAALDRNTVVVDGGSPPFDRLIRDGIVAGWLHFEGGANATDLDLAPSTLLSRLGRVRIERNAAESPIVSRYDPQQSVYFRGVKPDAVADEALSAYVARPRLPPPEMRPAILQREILDARYSVGRRIDHTAIVHLGNEIQAQVEAGDMVPDRTDVAFADLPQPFRDTILGMARSILNMRSERTAPTIDP